MSDERMAFDGPAHGDEALRVRVVIDWIGRMSVRYGGRVSDNETGRAWDWGQALCREQYGADFGKWPDSPTGADVARAIRWERGEWPAWAGNPARYSTRDGGRRPTYAETSPGYRQSMREAGRGELLP